MSVQHKLHQHGKNLDTSTLPRPRPLALAALGHQAAQFLVVVVAALVSVGAAPGGAGQKGGLNGRSVAAAHARCRPGGAGPRQARQQGERVQR